MTTDELISGVAIFLFQDQSVLVKSMGSIHTPIIARAVPGCKDLMTLSENIIAKYVSIEDVSDLIHLGDTELNTHVSRPMMLSVFAAAVASNASIQPTVTQWPVTQENGLLLSDWLIPAYGALCAELAHVQDQADG